MYIDKLEIAFHLRSHPLRVAIELLPDILLERGSSPASNFLNLGVQKTRESQRVGAAAS